MRFEHALLPTLLGGSIIPIAEARPALHDTTSVNLAKRQDPSQDSSSSAYINLASSTHFQFVQDNFTVPTIQSNEDQELSIWIGLQDSAGNLWQAGIVWNNGNSGWAFFTEMPNVQPPQLLTNPVSPGDTITVQIQLVSPTQGHAEFYSSAANEGDLRVDYTFPNGGQVNSPAKPFWAIEMKQGTGAPPNWGSLMRTGYAQDVNDYQIAPGESDNPEGATGNMNMYIGYDAYCEPTVTTGLPPTLMDFSRMVPSDGS